MTFLLCLATVARAQNVAPEDLQRAAKEEMNRIMREGMKPPEKKESADTIVKPSVPAAPVPPEAPAVAPVQAPTIAEEEKAPPPCTPEKKDFSAKPPSTAKKYARRQEEIDKIDANCDGLLQAEEIQKGIETRFDAADTDKNGDLSQAESAAIVVQFKTDGQEEYGATTDKKARKLENKLEKIDSNSDGKISRGEYTGYYKKRYGKFDKSRDGTLDVTEYETDVESKPSRDHGN